MAGDVFIYMVNIKLIVMNKLKQSLSGHSKFMECVVVGICSINQSDETLYDIYIFASLNKTGVYYALLD